MFRIVPAIIPRSFESFKENLIDLSFATELQIDVVDGKFVPEVSWPYSPEGEVSEVKDLINKFTIEIDLMVNNPIKTAKQWLDVDVDMLVFHIESVSLDTFKNFVKTTSKTIGVSANNDTSLEDFFPYIEVADYVQLMGIAKIGSQGEGFDERVLDRIKIINQKFPNHLISIDGSVNKNTITQLKQAGADRFVSGSAILTANNPTEAYLNLQKLVS